MLGTALVVFANSACGDRLPPGVRVIYLRPPAYANRPPDSGPYSLQDIETVRGLARIGDGDAQANLGIMLASRGEYAQAVYWYRQAAQAGVAVAAYNLGTMYFNGQGVPKDDLEGHRWFMQAAKRGYASAEFGLAMTYFNGQGVQRDPVQGIAWYEKAARRGLPAAQFNLAVVYANGDGVAADPVKAYAWMLLAQKNGLDASGALATIAGRMTPAQLAAAEALSRKWSSGFALRARQ